MVNFKIISTIAVLLLCVSSLEADFKEIRAKQMAAKGDKNYNYVNIKNKKDWEEQKKKNGGEIGMNTNNIKGRKAVNVVIIKNVRMGFQDKVGKFKNRIANFKKNKAGGENIGVRGKIRNGMKIDNKVIIKNSKISIDNAGVKLKGRKASGLNINNQVDIKNSESK